MTPFRKLLEATNLPSLSNQTRILGIDPGGTTGWALLKGSVVESSGQLRTMEMQLPQFDDFDRLLRQVKPDYIAMESYRVYSWMKDQHEWSEIETLQIIGVLKYMIMRHDIPFVMQTAQVAKQFCTDEKLLAWDLWKKGQRHARDAIRHAVYFQLFQDTKKVEDDYKKLVE